MSLVWTDKIMSDMSLVQPEAEWYLTESVCVLEGVEETDEEGVVQLHQYLLLPHHILRLPLPHDVSLLQHLDYNLYNTIYLQNILSNKNMLLYSVKNRMIINNMNSDLFTTTILNKFAFTPFDDYLLAYSVLLSTSFAKYT